MVETVRQHAHDLDGHFRKIAEQLQKMFLADLQGFEPGGCLYRSGTRDITEDGDFADDGVQVDFGNLDLAGWAID